MTGNGRVRRVPPGRAGRLWLVQRLTVSRRALDLLDRKLQVLRAELQRRRGVSLRTAAAWEQASRSADEWLARAVLLGGQRSLRLAPIPPPAEVSIVWTRTMGLKHPDEASCHVPPLPVDAAPATNSALVTAHTVHAVALEAAVRHAAALEAVRRIEAELTTTSRRLRAIQDRWIPSLELALAARQLMLDEQEHGDAVRLSRALPPRRLTQPGNPATEDVSGP